MKYFLIFFLIFFQFACHHKEEQKFDQYYSIPLERPKTLEEGHLKRILIFSTNDFHGNLTAKKEKVTNSLDKQTYHHFIGGAEILSSYIRILRKFFPKELILLDAGDTFSGTLISKESWGKSVSDFYNYLRYDAMIIGNHEFDFGSGDKKLTPSNSQDILQKLISRSKNPYIVSNIFQKSKNKIINWPNTYPSILKYVNGVKIGIIGITTVETPDKTIKEYTQNLTFKEYPSIVEEESKKLKEKGAEIILLLSHAGVSCKTPIDPNKFKGTSGNEYCDLKQGEISKLLNQLPKGTVDAVITGHTHSIMAYKINDIPVVQGKNNGEYFSLLEIIYDKNQKKILKERTKFLGPIRYCSSFFDTTKDCYQRKNPFPFKQMIPATFMGELVLQDTEASKILAPYRSEIKQKREEIITTLDDELIHKSNKPSPLGTFVADAIRFATNTEVAVTNSGSIRTNLPKGEISYEMIFNVAPFFNNLMTIEMTGKELKDLIRVGTSGAAGKGIANFSGLNLTISLSKDAEILDDLDKNNIREKWERNRVVSATLSNGKKIDDQKTYLVGTQTFLGINGGDHFDFIFDKIPDNRKKIDYHNTYRDAIIQYFKDLKKKEEKFHTKEKNYLEYTKSKTVIED